LPDITIRFIIPDAKSVEAVDGFIKVFPNETLDPDWGGEVLSNENWMKSVIRNYIDRTINKGRRVIFEEGRPPPGSFDDSWAE
jgi:hypothetical protein